MDTVKPIREMTRVELEALAKERGMPARTRLGKRELMERLEGWRGPRQDELSRLRRMPLSELLRIAKERKISRKWRMRKEELVRALIAAGQGDSEQSRLQEGTHRPSPPEFDAPR